MIGKRDKALLAAPCHRGPSTVLEIATAMLDAGTETECTNEQTLADMLRPRISRMLEDGLIRQAPSRRVIASTIRRYEALMTPNGVRRDVAPV